ncbi:hypothetical protein K3495_g8599 [Podosphaera aphanis]|nr:hypothetical protein K3495_g8599 [Podosphaera aphanis]
MAALENSEDADLDDDCKLCKHHHKNRDCFKQHPELAVRPKGRRYLARKAIGNRKGKAKTASNFETDDSDSDEAGAIVATASIRNLHLAIYDTDASHHFVPCESMFYDMITRNEPIKFYQAVGSTSLPKQGTARTHADFAADPSTSRSTSGMLVRLPSGTICWKSYLQREVLLSATEAEYLAANETCRQLQWVKSLIQELGLTDRIEGPYALASVSTISRLSHSSKTTTIIGAPSTYRSETSIVVNNIRRRKSLSPMSHQIFSLLSHSQRLSHLWQFTRKPSKGRHRQRECCAWY